MRLLPFVLILAACGGPAPLGPLAPDAPTEGDAPEGTTDPGAVPEFLRPRPDSLADTAVDAFLLAEAMENGDTEAAGRALAAALEDAGFDLPDDLSWRIQGFEQPISFYSSGTRTVTLSAMPNAAQTDAYWQNWSALLTGGAWAPEAFFADAAEARRLAAFNQAYLGAHELGHALAYRYAVNPRTDDGNVNCQELLADRVAAAALDRVARADARFADLRTRYLALLASIQGEVPRPVTMPPRQRLLADCRGVAVADVDRRDPATLVPYASAFFARTLRLHEGDGPEPLAALADGVFLPELRAYFAGAPAASGAVAVDAPEDWYVVQRSQAGADLASLLADLRANARAFSEVGLEPTYDAVTGAVSVAPDGTPWALEVSAAARFDSLTSSYALRTIRLDTGELTSYDFGADADGDVHALEAVAAVADGEFVGLVQSASLRDTTAAPTFRLVRFARGLRWGPPLALAPGKPFRLLHDAGGNVLLSLASGAAFWAVDTGALTLGPRGEDPEPVPMVGLHPELGAVLADVGALGVMRYDGGRMTVGPGGAVLYLSRDVDAVRLAGSGFPASRGGTDPDRVAFQEVLAAQPLADAAGTVVVIERGTYAGPQNGVTVRRLVVPALARGR